MISTTPRRRITRQRSHIGFTDALTFTLSSRVVSNQFRRGPTGPRRRTSGHKKTALRPIENGSRGPRKRRLAPLERPDVRIVALHAPLVASGGVTPGVVDRLGMPPESDRLRGPSVVGEL